MRNKIKQLLKKEGGFTLVELLAVLAILALIVGIAVPMIGNVISSAETKSANAQIELIEDAARLYDLDENAKADPTIGDLIQAKYLEDDFLETKVKDVTVTESTKVSELPQKK